MLDKILYAIIALAALVMIGICAWYQVKYVVKKADVDFKKQQIETLQIAEDIANKYDSTLEAYNTVKTFTDTTHSNNIVLLQFIEDLERILPTGTTVNDLSASNGKVTFKVTTTSKEAIADFIVEIKKLDYVKSFDIPSFTVEKIEGYEAPEFDEEDEDVVIPDGAEYIYTGEKISYDFSCKLIDKDFVAGEVEVATDPSQVSDDEGGEE